MLSMALKKAGFCANHSGGQDTVYELTLVVFVHRSEASLTSPYLGPSHETADSGTSLGRLVDAVT